MKNKLGDIMTNLQQILACAIALNCLGASLQGMSKVPVKGSQESTLEAHKSQLPKELRSFVDDFATWEKEDRAKVKIFGLGCMISGLSPEKEAPYGGSLGYWIDCRTQTQQQRVSLITCLETLQK